MKTKILTLFAICLVGISCSQSTGNKGYTITGSIEGVNDTVYLTVFEGKTPVKIDSTTVVNGEFSFTGEVQTPIYAAIEVAKQPIVRFFLENAAITISGTAASPEKISVKGSATQDTYAAYRSKSDSLEQAGTSDSLITVTAQEFVKANPASVAAAYVLYRELSYQTPYQELNSYVNAFDTTVRQSVYTKIVKDMAIAQENTSVGRKFTDITTTAPDSSILKLSDVVAQGKYVLLDFWASWCPPCRAESPNMVAAYNRFKNRGFEIFAISLDKDRQAWMDGIKSMNLNWLHGSELTFWTSEPATIYGVRSIPSNILIAPDSTIIARNLMGEELHRKLEEVLKPASKKTQTGSTPQTEQAQ